MSDRPRVCVKCHSHMSLRTDDGYHRTRVAFLISVFFLCEDHFVCFGFFSLSLQEILSSLSYSDTRRSCSVDTSVTWPDVHLCEVNMEMQIGQGQRPHPQEIYIQVGFLEIFLKYKERDYKTSGKRRIDWIALDRNNVTNNIGALIYLGCYNKITPVGWLM